MQLNKTCLKIDKPNAKAMIVGYCKDGKLNQQSIWLAVKDWLTAKDRVSPSLLTFNRSPTRFELSQIGEETDAEDVKISFKYIAELDREYFVRNDITLWETVCSNGLFDIWNPEAPYKRFDQAKSDRARFRIQLLRIYEIDHEFNNNDIRHASSRIDKLKSLTQEVEIIGPVIPNEEFHNIKELLEDSIGPYWIK
jgi:hypothetical protein